ncbi:Rieske (2Fe-2S) protein [Flindersiella endophytica]
MSDIERRRLLAVVAAAGAAVPLVAACGGDDSTSPGSGTETEDTSAPEETPSPSETEETPSPEETSEGGGNALGKTSDIPVGGGKVFAEQKVVVTQPQAGDFKGFSAICTHRGCPVKDVSGGTINCPCHGSKYKIADGSVSNGPATKGLAAANIKVDGDSITLA